MNSILKRFFAFAIDALFLVGFFIVLDFCLKPFHSLFSTLPLIGFWFYGALFICCWLYFSILESSKQQATFGKKILGLKVENTKGEKISFLRASIRYFGKIFSYLSLSFGFLMIGFSKKNQGLHDKIAATFVKEEGSFS